MNNHFNLRRGAGVAAIAAGALLGAAAPIAVSAANDTGSTHAVRPEAQQNRGIIPLSSSGSATVSGAVSHGDWHHWGVHVQAGQEIGITVAALRSNASFELYTPSGEQLANDVRTFIGTASESGFFAIDVGSTGGTANYVMFVSVTGTPTAPAPPAPPVPPSGQVNKGQIQFAPGASSGSVSGTVASGGWHHWGARARAGQQIEISISGGATFELYTPSGDQMANHVTSFSGTLPADGNYAIDVGPANGSANYTLTVSITGSPSAPSPAPPVPPSGQLNKGQIQFAPGASSGSVSGTVASGGWHHWGARARAGQQIEISISGGATFELYTPSGDQMANDVTSFSGTLPADGNYAIDVGSADGTANYTLTVTIT